MNLKDQLLIPFNQYTKTGKIYNVNSYDWNKIINKGAFTGVLFGEFGGDNSNLDIIIKYISHTISNIRVEDDGLFGDIKILETKTGNILKKYINVGFQIFFRMKAYTKYYSKNPVVISNIVTFNAYTIDDDWYNVVEFRNFKINKIMNRINNSY